MPHIALPRVPSNSLTVTQIRRHLQGTTTCKACPRPVSGNKKYCAMHTPEGESNMATTEDTLRRHELMEVEMMERKNK